MVQDTQFYANNKKRRDLIDEYDIRAENNEKELENKTKKQPH